MTSKAELREEAEYWRDEFHAARRGITELSRSNLAAMELRARLAALSYAVTGARPPSPLQRKALGALLRGTAPESPETPSNEG